MRRCWCRFWLSELLLTLNCACPETHKLSKPTTSMGPCVRDTQLLTVQVCGCSRTLGYLCCYHCELTEMFHWYGQKPLVGHIKACVSNLPPIGMSCPQGRCGRKRWREKLVVAASNASRHSLNIATQSSEWQRWWKSLSSSNRHYQFRSTAASA